MSEVTAEQVNDWQASSGFHPLTCRNCRGFGDCPRVDVGRVGGDHHVLTARPTEDGSVELVCDCCGYTQPFPRGLEGNVRFHFENRQLETGGHVDQLWATNSEIGQTLRSELDRLGVKTANVRTLAGRRRILDGPALARALALRLRGYEELADTARTLVKEFDRVREAGDDAEMDWTGPLVDGPMRHQLDRLGAGDRRRT